MKLIKVIAIPKIILSNFLKLNPTSAVILVTSDFDLIPKFKSLLESKKVPHKIFTFAEGDGVLENPNFINAIKEKENQLRSIGIPIRLLPITEEEADEIISFILSIKNQVSSLIVCCDDGMFRSQAIAKFVSERILNQPYNPQTFDKLTFYILDSKWKRCQSNADDS